MNEPRPWRQVRRPLAAAWTHASRRLLACDFDGTLAPLVDHPDAARLPSDTRQLLGRLARLPGLHVAIVSGRGLADLQSLIDIPDLTYVGNHGWQIQGPAMAFEVSLSPEARLALSEIGDRVRGALARWPGLFWEDKGATGSLHYRQVEIGHHAAVRDFTVSLADARPSLELHEGSQVWEFRPRDDWNKGRAVTWLLNAQSIAAEHALALGDDVSDEQVFTQLPQSWTVQVGDRRPTAARLSAANPADVAELLKWLVDLG